MISWYRWSRRLAYISFAVGLLVMGIGEVKKWSLPESLQFSGPLLIAAFCFLLFSQALWVVLIMRRNAGTSLRPADEDEDEDDSEELDEEGKPTSGS